MQELKLEFFSALHEPSLPMPALRREAYVFPTVIQDLLGNAFAPPNGFEMPYFLPGLDILRDNINDLEENFMDSLQIQRLSVARWLLKCNNESAGGKRYSLASQSTASDTEKSNGILVQMMLTIIATVKVHCKAVVAYLNSFTDSLSFLSAYCVLV